nr:(Fe-S)-binding protein [Anaerolineae bacterium]
MPAPQPVDLFVTCLIDALFPDVARSVMTVFNHLGIHVNVPEGQTCCGQPAFNAGYWDEAREMARHMLDVFARSDRPVIIPSGSCGAMVSQHYLELFKDDPEYRLKAEALAGRTVEFTQYLVDILGITDIGARFEHSVVYHPSCHTLRGMGIDRQPRALLNKVKGLRVLDQTDPYTCCGFGGVFAVKMGEISGAMLANRLKAFQETQADYVVACDVSCLMHIEGGLRKAGSPIRTMHIAQLLDQGLGK